MKVKITIKEEGEFLVLSTPFGPAGPRLRRGVELPVKAFSFPNTEEGRIQAERAKGHLQDYCDKYIVLRK